MSIAKSGDEAIRILATRKEEFDVVLCDMVMPGASGLQVRVHWEASIAGLR